MYLHIRKYQLVNARWRDVIDLTDYEETISQVVGTVFGNDLLRSALWNKLFYSDSKQYKQLKYHNGILVNMGKRLAANLQSITCHAMRIYHVNGHPDARQLFHCFDADCLWLSPQLLLKELGEI